MRPSKRRFDELRPIVIETNVNAYAEGSVMYQCGNTKVLCTVSVNEGVPRFLRDKKQGWLTAEYGMLPRATHTRNDREAARGKQSGRTMEIQRLIGRSLRSMIDLSLLGDFTLVVDCDVLQADGGTRTASINAASLALVQAVQTMQYRKMIVTDPIKHLIGAISCGVVNGTEVLDLDYQEDSNAESDLNVVRAPNGVVEVQGTSEGVLLTDDQLQTCLTLAKKGIDEIHTKLQENIIKK